MDNLKQQLEQEFIAAAHMLYEIRNGGSFYAHLLMSCDRIFNDPKVTTAAINVSDHITIYINGDFFTNILKHELDITNPIDKRTYRIRQALIIAHELLHVIFSHPLRFKEFGNRKRTNIAMDFVVNSCLDKTILDPINAGILFPDNFNLPNDKDLKWYYDNMKVLELPNPDNHLQWEDATSDNQKQEVIKTALQQAMIKIDNVGSLPEPIKQVLDSIRTSCELRYDKILGQFLTQRVSDKLTYSNKRISKRFKTRPGLRHDHTLKVAVLVDVSASINDNMYKNFINHTFAVVRHLGEATIIEWDVKIESIYVLNHFKDRVTRSGKGGTNPDEAIHWVNDNDFDVAIFLTDGEFNHEIAPIKIPALFVLTREGSDEYLKQHQVVRM